MHLEHIHDGGNELLAKERRDDSHIADLENGTTLVPYPDTIRYDVLKQGLEATASASRFAALLNPFLGMFSNENPIIKEGRALQIVDKMKELLHMQEGGRPPFGIDTVRVAEKDVAVTEEVLLDKPFGSLLHFKKDVETGQPRVLIVAPMSGHFATLLRDTVRTMLPDHDVYITDWKSARDVPLSEGRFGLNEYTDTVIDFIHAIGPDTNVLAVCQSCIPSLVATGAMSHSGDLMTPRSLTLMAGPVDTRVQPTDVDTFAEGLSIDTFRNSVIAQVPEKYPGAGRLVYPGAAQLTAFIMLDPERHEKKVTELAALEKAAGELHSAGKTQEAEEKRAEAQKVRDFYTEYFSTLDLAAEFYLETIHWVFQNHDLQEKGGWRHYTKHVDFATVRDTAITVVEGGKDNICMTGQTKAAFDLCPNVPDEMKKYILSPEVGHYGVFSGTTWREEIYPQIKEAILKASSMRTLH